MAPDSSSTFRQPERFPLLEVRALRYLDCGPFSFSLGRRECLAISGRSGVGKSQLFRALTDLIPFTGEVLLEELPCHLVQAPEWRKKVTMVPAESVWWYDEVGEHFAGHERHSEKLTGWLQEFGFAADVLGWQVRRLSTGEKQRLALLRTLQYGPEVLLLDEPSSALDHAHTVKLESFVREYQKIHAIGVIWVSHDPEQLKRVADRELRLEKESLTEIRNGRGQVMGET